jgi:hypothetical protein
LLQGQATVAVAVTAAVTAAEPAAESAPAPGEPEALNRYDAVVGSDTQTPEILGRGFLAVVSIDPVAG